MCTHRFVSTRSVGVVERNRSAKPNRLPRRHLIALHISVFVVGVFASPPPVMILTLDEDSLALCIAFFAVVSYISAKRWARLIPKMFTPHIIAKQREIALLQKETAQLNPVSQLAAHSKSTRQIHKLEAELDALNKAQRKKGWVRNQAPVFVSWIIQLSALLPLYMLRGDDELVMLPQNVLGVWFAASSGSEPARVIGLPFIGAIRSLGVASWYLLVQYATAFVFGVVAADR